MHTGKRGFTLIELLVVVAIIVILIAILLPSLSQARQNALRAKCLSQLKQIGIAVYSYAAENNDFAPPYPMGDDGSDQGYRSNVTFSWYSGGTVTGVALMVDSGHLTRLTADAVPAGYMGGRPVLTICPARPKPKPMNAGDTSRSDNAVDYNYRGIFATTDANGPVLTNGKRSNIKLSQGIPGKMMMIDDIGFYSEGIHNGYSNMLMIDSHAASIPLMKYFGNPDWDYTKFDNY